MVIITLFCLIFALLVIRKVQFDLTKSIVLFIATWSVSLLIYKSGLFLNYPKIAQITWYFIGLTIVTTTALYLFGFQIKWNTSAISYDLKKVQKSSDIILILVVCSFLFTVYKLGLPPTLGGAVIRSEYYLSGIETVYLLIYVSIFLYAYIIQKTGSIKSVSIQLLIIIILIVLKGNKFAFFVFMLTLLFFFGRKIKVARIFLILLGIVVVFVLASTIYISSENEYLLRSTQISQLGFSLPYNFAFLIDPLVYFSSNIANLNAIINSNFSEWNYGSFSFKIIWQNLSFLVPSAENEVLNTTNWINSVLPFPWLNTYSALGSLFVDFGIVLSIIVFGILGFFSGIFDKIRIQKNPSLPVLFLGLSFYQFFSLSFFTFYFTNKEIITNVIVVVIVHLYASTEKRKIYE